MESKPHGVTTPGFADAALAAACDYSRYVRFLLDAEPQLAGLAATDRPFTADEMRALFDSHPPADETELQRQLRVLRKRVMVRLIARDIGGRADLAEVVTTVTTLAEIAISTALSHLDRWLALRHGRPTGAQSGKVQQLHVIGMGKLGGRELNASSDIDLVFVYPEDGETGGNPPLSNHEYFTRLARRLIAALHEITADGYVFRVDMRLRPYGDSGPLVMSFDMLENYFITQGREWERYAWIKGRPVTGDRGTELLELIRPFVYRRHLDYSAFASLRELHNQIRREVRRRDMLDDIKLGPGGIREIEFIVQLFQLIRGGRDPALRQQSTLAVLPLLAERNLLPEAAVAELNEAYVFLRNLEHRLQYRDDRQTQALPADQTERTLVARSMGFANQADFAAALDRHRERVGHHFDQIFVAAPHTQHALAGLWQDSGEPANAERCVGQLGALGFSRAADLHRRMMAMRTSIRYRQMPASSQSRLDRLVPLAIETAARCANPDATLERILQLLESISRRESYLAMLEEYPVALTRVADLMSASPWVAQYLTQHPILLDELLDTRTLYAAPDWPQLRRALDAQLEDAADDIEKQMDVLRHFKHVQTIRLVAQDLGGTLPLETLSDHLSDLACLILDEVLRLAWAGLAQRHRDAPAFAIIGYGKLGGKELGYASDLDLVFLYEDDAAEAAQNYARLAQRINNWLTSATPAGVLYDTDLRLRPDGASGLLVSPLASFRQYQMKQAWIWEHQALTRARFAAGDEAIGRKFEALRVTILRQRRDLPQLRKEVVAMRRKMLEAHPNTSNLFDLKHDRGGIIDVEFIVQFLVLGYSHVHAELTANIGNLALLKLAARLGLIGETEATAAHDAYRRFRQLQHSLRLRGETYARVPPITVSEAILAVLDLWHAVFGDEHAAA
ncbi:MAG: bifunctional [glutamate--ammonia ligase]-adenylyl-L-tyrosine phosphorylase/[glutamate--ammonia-ligase] adenylyltransferase [Burkholderiales bacterium]